MPVSNDDLPAKNLVEKARQKGFRVVTAESCTAGLAASLIAEIPGASEVLWGGFVTYTLEAKTSLLGVQPAILRQYGAVSLETARAMAEGALKAADVDAAVSVTGLAGPDGDGTETPVGTVCFGLAQKNKPVAVYKEYFKGDRNEVRRQAALYALNLLTACVE